MRVNWETEIKNGALNEKFMQYEQIKACYLIKQADEAEDFTDELRLCLQAILVLANGMEKHQAFDAGSFDIFFVCVTRFLHLLKKGHITSFACKEIIRFCEFAIKKGEARGGATLCMLVDFLAEGARTSAKTKIKVDLLKNALHLAQKTYRLGVAEALPLIKEITFVDLYSLLLDGVDVKDDLVHSLKFMVLSGCHEAAAMLGEVLYLSDDTWDKHIEDLLHKKIDPKRPLASSPDLSMTTEQLTQLLTQALGDGITKVILNLGFFAPPEVDEDELNGV